MIGKGALLREAIIDGHEGKVDLTDGGRSAVSGGYLFVEVRKA